MSIGRREKQSCDAIKLTSMQLVSLIIYFFSYWRGVGSVTGLLFLDRSGAKWHAVCFFGNQKVLRR
jgi:hypothetical protein